jgi:hypothetical protein
MTGDRRPILADILGRHSTVFGSDRDLSVVQRSVMATDIIRIKKAGCYSDNREDDNDRPAPGEFDNCHGDLRCPK